MLSIVILFLNHFSYKLFLLLITIELNGMIIGNTYSVFIQLFYDKLYIIFEAYDKIQL